MEGSDRKIVPDGGDVPDGDTVIGYMCLVDFEWKLGVASGGNTVHPSIEDCRHHRKCVEACGIVEVEVKFRRVVQEGRDPG